jgi:hypothetical protein
MVAEAVAWLVTEPASRSAWVMVYAALQVRLCLRARLDVSGQVTVVLSSLMTNGPFKVAGESFVTT